MVFSINPSQPYGGVAFQRPKLVVPQFNDHDLPGSRDSAIRARTEALSAYKPTQEAFAVARQALDVQGRAQLFLNQNQTRQTASRSFTEP